MLQRGYLKLGLVGGLSLSDRRTVITDLSKKVSLVVAGYSGLGRSQEPTGHTEIHRGPSRLSGENG